MGRTSLRPWFMGNKMQFEAVACRLFLHYSYTLAQKASNYGIFCFYNINNEDNEILQRSPSLLGYSKLLYYIKTAAKDNGGDLKSAIDTSVKQCMEEGLIEDFLRKHSREVTGMLFNEITVEEFAEIRAREAYEDGEKSGEKIGFVKGEKSGFTKGETAGLAKGAAQEKREIAKNFKKAGIPTDLIAENTGLSVAEVEQL